MSLERCEDCGQPWMQHTTGGCPARTVTELREPESPLVLDDFALDAAERAYWKDDGVSRHNLAAAIRVYLARSRPPEEPPREVVAAMLNALEGFLRDEMSLSRFREAQSHLGGIRNMLWPIGRGAAPLGGPSPEALAQRFHEIYERLAPRFGYATRLESALPWDEVPENNRRLMVAVCAEVLSAGTECGGLSAPAPSGPTGESGAAESQAE